MPHQRLLMKLAADGLGGDILQWIGNWLSNRKQKGVSLLYKWQTHLCTSKTTMQKDIKATLNGQYSGWRNVYVVFRRGLFWDDFLSESQTTLWIAWYYTRVSAAADRPARRSDTAHAKYTISHHVVIKQFLLLGLSLIHIWRCRRIERCRSRWSPYH